MNKGIYGYSYRVWLTVYPCDADRLAEGQQEQSGPTANMVVQQLKEVHPTLKQQQWTLFSFTNEYYRCMVLWVLPIKAKTQETFYWLDCHIKCTKSPSNPHFNTMLFLCYYCEWSPQMLTVDMHLSKLYDLCTSTTYTVNLFNLILPQWQPYKPLWPTKGQVDSKQNRWAAEAAPVWSLGEGRRETNQPGTSWDTPDQQTVMRHTVDIQKFFVLFI